MMLVLCVFSFCLKVFNETFVTQGWWLRGTVVERRFVTGELSLSYARPAADG